MYLDGIKEFFIVSLCVAAVVGWAVIEFFLWLISHVSLIWV